MDARTGEIYSQEEIEERKRKLGDFAKQWEAELVPIEEKLLPQIKAMDREHRKAWARKQQHRTKHALKNSR